MRTRTKRLFSLALTTALVAGAFAMPPAEAAKRKKKKKPVCAAYTPTSWGAEQEIVKVTDANTSEAPLTIELETPAGLGFTHADSPDQHDEDLVHAHTFVNVQVDSAAPLTGLYGSIAFSPQWDYDLSFRGDDGVSIAYSAGGAPYTGPFSTEANGGTSAPGSETINGLETADCQGLLVDVTSAMTPGETVTLTLWLGEVGFIPGG